MKTKSITLIILMLAFLSIFSVNVTFIHAIDGKLDQFHFFKAEFDAGEIRGEETNSTCEQSSDTLSSSLSQDLSWFMFSTSVAFIMLQPINLK